jgi:hypothetical protein
MYNNLMRRFHLMVHQLERIVPGYDVTRGFEVGGVVWFQGEADAITCDENGVGMWHHYEQNLIDLLADFRYDLGLADIKPVIVQINDARTWDSDARSCSPSCGGRHIRSVQQSVAEQLGLRLVVTSDLNDEYHYDPPSHLTIGHRIAMAFVPLLPRFSDQPALKQHQAAVQAAGRRFYDREYYAQTRPRLADTIFEDLVLWHRFDGAIAPHESFGAKFEATFIGPEKYIPGVVSEALQLTPGTYFRSTYTDSVAADGLIHALSVSLWIQTVSQEGPFMVSKGRLSGWKMQNNGSQGMATFTLVTDTGERRTISAAPSDQTIYGDGSEWRHIAATFDGQSNEMVLYIDGIRVYHDCSLTHGQFITPAPDDHLMLHSVNSISAPRSFDELMIWKRALSSSEVKQLYLHGSRLTPCPLTSTEKCTAGAQLSCYCQKGMQGIARCTDDGSGFGPCECRAMSTECLQLLSVDSEGRRHPLRWHRSPDARQDLYQEHDGLGPVPVATGQSLSECEQLPNGEISTVRLVYPMDDTRTELRDCIDPNKYFCVDQAGMVRVCWPGDHESKFSRLLLLRLLADAENPTSEYFELEAADDGRRMSRSNNSFVLVSASSADHTNKFVLERPTHLWQSFTAWSGCSASCGSGVRTRQLQCTALPLEGMRPLQWGVVSLNHAHHTLLYHNAMII